MDKSDRGPKCLDKGRMTTWTLASCSDNTTIIQSLLAFAHKQRLTYSKVLKTEISIKQYYFTASKKYGTTIFSFKISQVANKTKHLTINSNSLTLFAKYSQ